MKKLIVTLALVAATSVGYASSAASQDTGAMPSAATANAPQAFPVPTTPAAGTASRSGTRGSCSSRAGGTPGTLEFRESSLRWIDSKRTEKNVLIPFAQITEQQLTCLKKAGGNECFEWVVKTRSEEYRFRDAGWRQGENAKVQDIFEFFRSAYPNLISSRTPVDEK